MRKRKIKQNLKYRRRRFCLASFLILVVVIIVCHVKTKKKEPIEQNENFVKKCLTLQGLSGILTKLSRGLSKIRRGQVRKEIFKNLKKVLDKLRTV